MRTSPFMEELRAEGRAEALAGVILRGFRVRFRIEPPADILARVQQEQNLDRLNRWVDAALSANALEDFLVALRQD